MTAPAWVIEAAHRCAADGCPSCTFDLARHEGRGGEMAPAYPTPAVLRLDGPPERLRSAVKDMVLSLRLAAEDLDQADPFDAKELDGKLSCLIETVMDGSLSITAAGEAYDQVPEEPIR